MLGLTVTMALSNNRLCVYNNNNNNNKYIDLKSEHELFIFVATARSCTEVRQMKCKTKDYESV
jgi:hypothetical protein